MIQGRKARFSGDEASWKEMCNVKTDVLVTAFQKMLLGARKGSRDGAVVGAFASHRCGLGSILARCHMWVEFVVGSRPCSEGFSPGSPVFLPPEKLTLQIPI